MEKRKFKIKTTFIDREQELRLLRNYLEAQPNSILFLYGPKSSGKTTLLYYLCDELAEDKNYEVKFLNLRETFLDSYEDFLQAFFKTRNNMGNSLKVSTKRQYSLFGLFKLDALTERMLKGKNEDPFVVMKVEFQKLVKKGRKPLIIIDEFHKLRDIYLPEKQKTLIMELMNFFVAMTKESHLCHVIIASSDAFFIEEVYSDSKLRKTSAFQNLDYLSYSDVKEWLSHIDRYNEVADFSLNEKEIELVWDTVGGSPWEIQYILERLFETPLTEIVDKIKRERVAMVADWCFQNETNDRKKLMKSFLDHSVQPIQAFDPFQRSILGEAVHDNILFYDPVEGAYGIQGRSLEWGVKEYFGSRRR
jgi:AAA+ ATPase superfamily predicted ATPase